MSWQIELQKNLLKNGPHITKHSDFDAWNPNLCRLGSHDLKDLKKKMSLQIVAQDKKDNKILAKLKWTRSKKLTSSMINKTPTLTPQASNNQDTSLIHENFHNI